MKLFGEFLVEQRVVSKQELVQALLLQNKNTPDILSVLLDHNKIESDSVYDVILGAQKNGLSFVDTMKKLGYWNDDFEQVFQEELKSKRPPLGQILVEMEVVELDRLASHLDEFLSVTLEEEEEEAKKMAELPKEDEAVIVDQPQNESEAAYQIREVFKVNEMLASEFCSLMNQYLKGMKSKFCHGGEIDADNWKSLLVDDLKVMKSATQFVKARNTEAMICKWVEVLPQVDDFSLLQDKISDLQSIVEEMIVAYSTCRSEHCFFDDETKKNKFINLWTQLDQNQNLEQAS